MISSIKSTFISNWNELFPTVELPITFYYTNDPGGTEVCPPKKSWQCFLSDLVRVRNGKSLCFNSEAVSCFGGKRYLGFSQSLSSNFEYFLSCGIPGKLEGERYKKTPEIVKEMLQNAPTFTAPAEYLLCKRLDNLSDTDKPEVVVFFATADVMSGLFTLSGYDESDLNAAIAPFCAGCGSIVLNPYLEIQSKKNRSVIGMFDVSARPYVPEGALSFTVSWERFNRMANNMKESFLITRSWEKVRNRISK